VCVWGVGWGGGGDKVVMCGQHLVLPWKCCKRGSATVCPKRPPSNPAARTLKLRLSSLNLRFSVGTKPARKMLIPSRTLKGSVTTPAGTGAGVGGEGARRGLSGEKADTMQNRCD
jgi:hypothetical protein